MPRASQTCPQPQVASQPLPLNAFALVSSLHPWQRVTSQPWCHACNMHQFLLTTATAHHLLRRPCLFQPRAVFAAFFLAVSLYNRLDFTITKDERWQEQQAADKARGVLQQLLAIWEGRCGFRVWGSGQGMQDWVGTTDGVEGWQLHPGAPCFGNLL